MSARIKTGSPLDAIADGPQARTFGLTRRLHDVAARYELVLRSHAIPIEDSEVTALGLALNRLGVTPTSLATPALMEQLKDQLRSVAGCAQTLTRAEQLRVAGKIRQLSVIGLVVLLERLEEVALMAADS